MRKKILLLAIVLFMVGINWANSQSIPPSGGPPICMICVPPGWNIVSQTPDISDKTNNQQATHFWVPQLTDPPSGNGTFISGAHNTTLHEVVSTTITGLTAGYTYTLNYHLVTAQTMMNGQMRANFANQGILILKNGNDELTQTTNFEPGVNTGKWVPRSLSFVAAATTATVTLTQTGSLGYQFGAYVGWDFAATAVKKCDAGVNQVSLSSTNATTTCPANKFDLTKVIVGKTSPNVEVRWFTNPNHTGFKVLAPSAVGAGTYYAFYYDTVNLCYNTDDSKAVVTVTGMICEPCNAGSNQATLSTNKIKNICPATLIDLKPLVTNVAPPGSVIVFYSTPNHAPGTMIPEVQMTGKIYVYTSGTYYAFFYDQVNECFNTNNSTAAVVVTITDCPAPCNAGTEPVALHGAFENNICPATTVDITKAIASVPSQDISIVWFTNPNHTGNPYPNPTTAAAGNYYAFFYDTVNDCYNTDNSSAKVTAIVNPCLPPCNAGIKQVTLFSDKASTKCPTNKLNLNTMFKGVIPDGVSVVWFTNPNHTGSPYPTPLTAEAGTYYAFLYDEVNKCYNTNNSNAMVVVTNVLCAPCNATTDQVVLSASSIKNVCPSNVVNLKPLYENAVPNGATLVFYSTPDHQPGTMVPEVVINGQGKINVSVPGIYYAFFFDQINSCFNTDYSTGQVTVTIDNCSEVCNAGVEQVGLILVPTLNNVCPVTTVNLSDALTGVNYPPLVDVRWFTNPNHTGNQYPTPQQAVAGEYYAFFYDAINNCYNTDNSTAKATVVINPCNEKVALNVKIYVQGAMHSNLPQMRNDLQTYFGNSQGLIPETDPYGSGLFVPNINNIAVSAEVVDWIKVEVRSAANPTTILETQSLFLRPNGLITNADYTTPKFAPQAEPVRIVVKHRNHLAIMSNNINTFTAGLTNYDFSTSLSQAYNDPGGLPQMVLKNGVWCMWAGDVNANQDFAIDVTDYNQEYISNEAAPYDVYLKTDLDMNGALDATDLNILYFNNTVAPYSVVQN
jgi:hypothetical protein